MRVELEALNEDLAREKRIQLKFEENQSIHKPIKNQRFEQKSASIKRHAMGKGRREGEYTDENPNPNLPVAIFS